MNQRGFANIILIILVVILSGATGYFFLRNSTSTIKINENDYNWAEVDEKSFQNNTYGFEFKYPSKFFLTESNKNSIFSVNLDRFDRSKDEFGHGAIMPVLSISVSQTTDKDIVKLKCSIPEKQRISDISFERCVIHDELQGDIINLFLSNQDNDFIFEFSGSSEKEVAEILSTFKFIR